MNEEFARTLALIDPDADALIPLRVALEVARREALREVWIAAGGFDHAFDGMTSDPLPPTLNLVREIAALASTVKNPLAVLDRLSISAREPS